MITYLSSAQEAQKQQYRTIAGDFLRDKASRLDSHEICLKEFLQELGHKGLLGISVPKEYSGQGGSFLEAILLTEALAAWEPGLALTLGNHIAVIEVLKKYGTDQQKSRYLPLLARGEAFATLAFSEETAGTDFEAVQTKLTQKDSDVFVTGTKTWVVTGDFATLVLALGRNSQDQLALQLIDVQKANELTVGPHKRTLGLRSSYMNDVSFNNYKSAANNALTGDAREIALYAMDIAKVVLASGALGLIEGAEQLAVEHARKRNQFGANIGQFQGVQWKLADMHTEQTGTRLQVYRAAWSHDEAQEEFHKYAAMAKYFAARSARLQSGEALQILAAAGLDAEHPLERFYRDAKTMEIVQGTAEFQKMLLTKELDI